MHNSSISTQIESSFDARVYGLLGGSSGSVGIFDACFELAEVPSLDVFKLDIFESPHFVFGLAL